MRHGFVIAAIAALSTGAPALAQPPIPLHGGSVPGLSSAGQVVQAQVPTYPPPTAVPMAAPPPPSAPQSEVSPPAELPSYVWEPGGWSWNGVQYAWEPGKYVERPAVPATLVPGHWEKQRNGWVWVDGGWVYPGTGSIVPPTGYPATGYPR